MTISSSNDLPRVIASAALLLGLVCAGGPAGIGIVSSAQAASSAGVCAMLSSGELHSLWGKDMKLRDAPGLPQAQGCDWEAADGHGGFLTVRVVPARYYTEPKLGNGFKALTGIGDKAFVVQDLGGWNAGARKGAKAVVIHVDGGKTNQGTAVTLITELIRKI
jgi:hypothetical protein